MVRKFWSRIWAVYDDVRSTVLTRASADLGDRFHQIRTAPLQMQRIHGMLELKANHSFPTQPMIDCRRRPDHFWRLWNKTPTEAFWRAKIKNKFYIRRMANSCGSRLKALILSIINTAAMFTRFSIISSMYKQLSSCRRCFVCISRRRRCAVHSSVQINPFQAWWNESNEVTEVACTIPAHKKSQVEATSRTQIFMRKLRTAKTKKGSKFLSRCFYTGFPFLKEEPPCT